MGKREERKGGPPDFLSTSTPDFPDPQFQRSKFEKFEGKELNFFAFFLGRSPPLFPFIFIAEIYFGFHSSLFVGKERDDRVFFPPPSLSLSVVVKMAGELLNFQSTALSLLPFFGWQKKGEWKGRGGGTDSHSRRGKKNTFVGEVGGGGNGIFLSLCKCTLVCTDLAPKERSAHKRKAGENTCFPGK